MINNKAFTLVELILVVALLTTLLALVAPSISRSFHGRDLDNQALALFAATEHARSEAISQGIPMTLWADADRFGVRAGQGFEGVPEREKEWTLHRDVQFEEMPETEDGLATFQPDGTLDLDSADELRLVHRDGESIAMVKKNNGYQIEK